MWSRQAETWQDDGVCADGPWASDLKVYSNAEPYTIQVLAGRANISGFHYYLDSETSLPIEGNTASQARYDLVVVRVDRAANRVTLGVKQGTPGGLEPTVDRTWETREFALARVRIAANSTSVATSDVTDYRAFMGKNIRTYVGGGTGVFPQGSIYYNMGNQRHLAVGATSTHQALAYRSEAGAMPVTSTTRPSAAWYGALIYETDTGRTYVNIANSTQYTNWHEVSRPVEVPPIALLRQQTAMSIANNTMAAVVFTEKGVDNKQGWKTATPDRYIIPENGWYEVHALVYGPGGTNGYIDVAVQKDNNVGFDDYAARAYVRPSPTGSYHTTISGICYYTKDSYVRLVIDNRSGATLNLGYSSLSIRQAAPWVSGQIDW
jgi:hypothetical protein